MTTVSAPARIIPQGESRNLSLDLLKLVLAAMVAGLHANLLADHVAGIQVFLKNGLFRIAVPTFFVITGFYLERQLALQGTAWFTRILSMWAIWTMVYAGWWFDFDHGTLKSSAAELLKGWYHLWYLVALVVGAAIFLAVRPVLSSSRGLLAAALTLFVIGVALQYAGRLNLVDQGPWALRLDDPKYTRNALFFAFPFLTLGVLIAREQARLARLRGKGIILALGLAGLGIEAAVATQMERNGNDMYLSLFVVSPLLFMLMRQAELRGHGKNLAHAATCIFLLHPLFQMTLQAGGAGSVTVFLGSVILCVLAAPVVIRLNRWAPLL